MLGVGGEEEEECHLVTDEAKAARVDSDFGCNLQQLLSVQSVDETPSGYKLKLLQRK